MSIVYKGGTLVADEVWTAGTYVLTSQVVVLNFDLTFDTTLGDVVVKLNDYNISMQGAGSVTCIGSHRVILTSVNDNSVGEVVPGSTGMPERTDNTIAMFIVQPAAVSDLMLRHVDFRYCYNTHGAFVLFGSNLTTLTIQDVSLRNCTVTAANRCLFGHYADFTSSIATVSVQDLNIDRSNYVITTSASVVSFVGQHTNFTARGIFIEGNSSFPCAALFRLGLQPGIVQSPLLENILLVGVPTSGPHLQIIELNAAPFLGTKTVDIKYALFLGTANASNGGLVFTELYSASATINLQNSIFSGFTAPGNGSDFAIKRAVAVTLNENNNGFYNNYANILIDGGGSQVLDATDITTDPDIGTLPPEIVVDEACPFPDGYSVAR